MFLRLRKPSVRVLSERTGIYYGWFIVAAGFLANLAYSEQFSAAYSVFVYHLGSSTGWTRTMLAGVKTAGRWTEALVAPGIGVLVDRYGARWIMVAGGGLSGAALMLASTVEELWQLYLYVGVLAPLGGVCLGGFVTTVAVANWFVLRRGTAIAIASMGMSFGTMVLPLVSSGLIEVWGWRSAWFILGAAVIAFTVPAALLVRRRPEDLGMRPDGLAATPEGAAPTKARQRQEALLAADVVWRHGDILRSRLMWIMVFAWGFAQFAMASTTLHMVPFFLDLGFPLVIAAGALSLRSGIAMALNPVWGQIIERAPLKHAASVQFTLSAIGLGMWLLPPTPVTLLLGILFFGVGASGSQVIAEVIWASYYGRISLGTVRGITYPIQTIFAGAGPLAVGLLYDLSGNYESSFAVLLGGCLLSAALIQFARPPGRPRSGLPANPESVVA